MNSARILVVDDCEDFRAVVRLALERASYQVFEAGDGRSALALLDHAQPDLVLLDVTMPNMSGPQFVEEIRGRGDHRPFGIIAISGLVSAHHSPTKWFLSKPIQVDLLLGVVADFCGRRGTSPLWVAEQQRDSLAAVDARFQAVT